MGIAGEAYDEYIEKKHRDEINAIQKKLEIAIESLEKIAENDYGNSYEQAAEAIEALEKIK